MAILPEWSTVRAVIGLTYFQEMTGAPELQNLTEVVELESTEEATDNE